MRNSRKKVLITIISFIIFCVFGAVNAKNVFTRKGVQFWVNGSSDAAINDVIARMQKAKNYGFNMVQVDDSRFPIITQMADKTLNRYRKLHSEAEKLGLEIHPMSFGQLDAVRLDMSFAEAFPVKGTPFKVSGTSAMPINNPTGSIPNGGFEEWGSKLPNGWNVSFLAPGVNVVKDAQNKRSGTASVKIDVPKVKKAALTQKNLKLTPYRAYRLSVWVKTQNVVKARSIGFEVNGGGTWLLKIRDSRGVANGSANWKRYHWDFNSLHATSAELRLCVTAFHITTGTVWFDDAMIEEIGLQGTQTRSTTPVTVKSESGQVYVAGKDYTVGNGSLAIPAGSAIKNGETLKVDWFQIAKVETMRPPAAFCTPEIWNSYKTTASLLNETICGGNAKSFHLKPSEWRVAFWDPSCISQYRNAGEYMGGMEKKAADIMFQMCPELKEVYVWNDSYDPYHNARANYPYPVNQINGGKAKAWEGMHSKTIVMNWNVHNKEQSLYFYAGKDSKNPAAKRPQILCDNDAQHLTGWLPALNKLEAQYPNEKDVVVGVIFSSYSDSWDLMAATAQKCQAEGRWGTNDNPFTPIAWDENLAEVNGALVGNAISRKVALTVTGTRLQYQLKERTNIRLSLCNAAGRVIKTLATGERAAGKFVVDLLEHKLSAGAYFVDFRAEFAGQAQERFVKRAVIL